MGLAGLCHRPFGEGCTAQNAGFASVAPPRRSTPGSPSSSRLALASLPQPDLEVRSLRNAARQYPCARPSVLSPRAPDRAPARPAPRAFFVDRVDAELPLEQHRRGLPRVIGGSPMPASDVR